jgi:hypothetical protein
MVIIKVHKNEEWKHGVFYGWNKNPGASAAAGAPGFMQG